MDSVAFGSLFQFIRNGMNVKQDKSGDGLPVTRIETISDATVDASRVGFAGLAEVNCRDWLMVPGDILFSHINSVEHVGKCAIYRGEPEKLVHGMNLLCLRSDADKLLPEFAKYLIRGKEFRGRLSSFINKAVNQASVSIGNLKTISVTVPPLAEQRRIAEILDKADALRAKRRAALAQLDTLTQSIFLDMFGDPIENLRQFPIRPMIELVDSARPISYGILMPGPDQSEGIKYVRVVDMKDGGIELSGIRKTTEAISHAFRRSLLKPGDLLMSIRGHVGRFAVVPTELDGANITQDTARLAIVGADPVFVRECLRTVGFQRWMAKHTKGVAVRGINLGDVKLLPIILPDLSEQREFARLATATGNLRSSERTALAEFDSLFASLQHRAFLGDL